MKDGPMKDQWHALNDLDTLKELSLFCTIRMGEACCLRWNYYRAYFLAVYHHGVGLDDFVSLAFICSHVV